jgi:hypothetical protein
MDPVAGKRRCDFFSGIERPVNLLSSDHSKYTRSMPARRSRYAAAPSLRDLPNRLGPPILNIVC